MGIESRVYDGQAEPYQDLQLGRIDAVLLDLPVAIYYAKGNEKLEFMGEAFGKGAYAAMFRKDQEELAEQFDAAILKLAKNGELQRIYEKWQLWNDDQLALAEDQPPLTDVLKESGRLFTLSYYLPELLKAAVVTIEISVVSMALAMLIGLVVSVARLYGPLLLQWLAMIYVEFFRGIPVLLLLYVIYYGLPTAFGFALNPFTAAVIAFGLNYGAYEAEIYRAGIAAVPQGQWEAAISLGMSPLTTFRRIIFPQALRTIIPPVTNDFVALFKDTSLVSAIAVVELTKQYQLLSKSSLKYMEIGLVTAILYLAMSVPLGLLARRLEQAWGKGHA
jgi:polar amino acid transport system substrate-binding protein